MQGGRRAATFILPKISGMTYAKHLSRLAALLALVYILVAGFIFWRYKPTLGRSRFGGIAILQPNSITRISAHDLNCVRVGPDFVCNAMIENKQVGLTATSTRNPLREGEYTCAIIVDGRQSACDLSLFTYTAAYVPLSNTLLNLSEPTLASYRARNPLMHMSEQDIVKWMAPLPFLAIGSLTACIFFNLRGNWVTRAVLAVFGACVAFYPMAFVMFLLLGDFVD
jgi:hypothetical protein